MAEESGTPDPTELVRLVAEALNRRDFDAAERCFAPTVRLVTAASGTVEGREAVRGLLEDIVGTYETFAIDDEEMRSLGSEVVLAMFVIRGCMAGTSVELKSPFATVSVAVDGLIESYTHYTDPAEARAGAERLAQERGQAMSENLELVRSICSVWERGEYGAVGWAHPEIHYAHVGGPAPGTWTGVAGMAQGWRDILSVMTEHRVTVDEYRELDGGRVLVLLHLSGRGRTSGVDLGQMHAKVASLFYVRGAQVTRLVNYLDRDRALADLGLTE
jgi:ketosteroid isomerase-like protein